MENDNGGLYQVECLPAVLKTLVWPVNISPKRTTQQFSQTPPENS